MTTTVLKYVIHRLVPTYEALGWTRLDSLDGTHHGHYSAYMRWDGEGEPQEPAMPDREFKPLDDPRFLIKRYKPAMRPTLNRVMGEIALRIITEDGHLQNLIITEVQMAELALDVARIMHEINQERSL